MKYLVGIDGSRNAADAFEAVICDLLNPDKDELYITTIIKRDAVKFTGEKNKHSLAAHKKQNFAHSTVHSYRNRQAHI